MFDFNKFLEKADKNTNSAQKILEQKRQQKEKLDQLNKQKEKERLEQAIKQRLLGNNGSNTKPAQPPPPAPAASTSSSKAADDAKKKPAITKSSAPTTSKLPAQTSKPSISKATNDQFKKPLASSNGASKPSAVKSGIGVNAAKNGAGSARPQQQASVKRSESASKAAASKPEIKKPSYMDILNMAENLHKEHSTKPLSALLSKPNPVKSTETPASNAKKPPDSKAPSAGSLATKSALSKSTPSLVQPKPISMKPPSKTPSHLINKPPATASTGAQPKQTGHASVNKSFNGSTKTPNSGAGLRPNSSASNIASSSSKKPNPSSSSAFSAANSRPGTSAAQNGRGESNWDKIVASMKRAPSKKPEALRKKSERDYEDEGEYDEDEEYDSEMDDFIDDDDVDDGHANNSWKNYSKDIQKIFKYNPDKYKHIDDDDLSDMETDFNTLMKEEKRSLKLGMLEDFEELKREQELERQRALKKKKSQMDTNSNSKKLKPS